MKVLDLFSGIGGFSLGLERAGMETIAFCESDKDCHKVLNKHWPKVPIFNDIKKLNGREFKEVSVLCGGFPCQDISVAGKKKGLKGERSGLWYQYLRLISEVRPKYAIIENVSNLRSKGLGQIIKDLWEIGYDCEWHILSASNIGAVHPRERTWIIAYPDSAVLWEQSRWGQWKKWKSSPFSGIVSEEREAKATDPLGTLRLWESFASKEKSSRWWTTTSSSLSDWPKTQPPVCGMDDGLSGGLDKDRRVRIKQLGNSVVPQIVELIGRRIMKWESENDWKNTIHFQGYDTNPILDDNGLSKKER